MCEQQSRHASVQHKTAHPHISSPPPSALVLWQMHWNLLAARRRLAVDCKRNTQCELCAWKRKFRQLQMAKDTNTRTHIYGCKQMHPHKQLNSWPNCWCALITHTPHVPSSSLVCHNCQLATSICARSRFKYAFALSTQLVSFLITVVNKYTTQFGAHRH